MWRSRRHSHQHPPGHGEVDGGAGGHGVRHFRAAGCEGPGERSGAQVFEGVWPSPLLLGLRAPSLPSLLWHRVPKHHGDARTGEAAKLSGVRRVGGGGLGLPPSWNYPAPVSASSALALAFVPCHEIGQDHGCCDASQPLPAHSSSAARLRSDTPEPARVRPGWRPAHTRHPSPHHSRARPCTESGGSTARHAWQAGNLCGGSYGTEPPDLYTGRAAGLTGVRSGWGESSDPCRCCWGGCCRSRACRCWPCRTGLVVVVPVVVLIG